MTQALAHSNRAALEVIEEPPQRLDQHPVAVYLSQLSEGSRPTMLSSAETIARMLGSTALELPWHELRYQHVAALRSKLADKYQPATANKMLAALRGVLLQCSKLGLMSFEDYRRAVAFKPVQGTRVQKGRALSEEEIGEIFRSMDMDTVSGARDAAMVAVLYGSGLRRSEATGLKVGDVNFEERALLVHGKGNKERKVYFDEGVFQALKHWMSVRGEGGSDEPLLLPVDMMGNAYLRRMSDQAVRRRLEWIGKKLSLKAFSPHDLRRTFITRLLDKGVDIGTAQKLAGHSQVTTTQKYDRRGEEAKKRAVDVLEVPFSLRESKVV